ncbi:Protein of unknown function [Micromonospora pattaloongensis]|uniref:DUF4230 domain-containing protein n=1 Tax=Micromonospora pattaloongensis TaxID=405436 RepID=A0A1H3SLJ2_9ACTN|nr:DUF4230 domain-containing protein [Micromonospora pattaloongensis]SDZ38411.1 Protein of unknown function [Micromonospora pattaloongensis]
MAASGDVNQPTSEFPEYVKGQASPPDAGGPRRSEPAEGDHEPGPPRGGSAGLLDRSAHRGLLLLVGAVGLVIVLVLGAQAVGVWPQWRNPFAQQQTDRTQPPLLQSIQDLSRYVAAEGNFQVVVDLQQDRKYVPDFLINQRTLFIGAGSVEAYVDFAKISEGAIEDSADGKSVEIELPGPQLGQANLDLGKSYVFAEQRGLINRLAEVFDGDPNRQQQVYQLAQERITAAARDSGLVARAEENTRKMLVGLLRSLGYEKVTVSYTAA